jgi:hypothetical protein
MRALGYVCYQYQLIDKEFGPPVSKVTKHTRDGTTTNIAKGAKIAHTYSAQLSLCLYVFFNFSKLKPTYVVLFYFAASI